MNYEIKIEIKEINVDYDPSYFDFQWRYKVEGCKLNPKWSDWDEYQGDHCWIEGEGFEELLKESEALSIVLEQIDI